MDLKVSLKLMEKNMSYHFHPHFIHEVFTSLHNAETLAGELNSDLKTNLNRHPYVNKITYLNGLN